MSVLSQMIDNLLLSPLLAFPLGLHTTNSLSRRNRSNEFFLLNPPKKLPLQLLRPIRVHDSWKTRKRSLGSHSSSLLVEQLANRLQGDFDNYPQVLRDVANHKFPGPTGGHEHMHCTFVPLSTTTVQSLFPQQQNEGLRAVLAAYYLNGQPNQLFRLRLYTMTQEEQPSFSTTTTSTTAATNTYTIVRMKLYTPSDSTRESIKINIHQPLQWDQVLHGLQNDSSDMKAFMELQRCDVLWSTHPDPNRHTYLVKEDSNNEELVALPPTDAFHAVLEKPFVVLPSANYPGSSMIIKDELSLWENQLWINDRGYNVDTLEQMYGNTHDIPYKVARVTNIIQPNSSSQKFQRIPYSNNHHLMWTCGESYRTEKLYKQKMDALIGY
jgi:hypothetical protein